MAAREAYFVQWDNYIGNGRILTRMPDNGLEYVKLSLDIVDIIG